MTSVDQFTPPASCATMWGGRLAVDTGNAFRRGVTCPQQDVGGIIFPDNNCLPTATPPISAGCPLGYVSLSSTLGSVTCCPSEYGYRTEQRSEWRCVSAPTGTLTVTYLECPSNIDQQPSTAYGIVVGYQFYAQQVVLTSSGPTSTPTTDTIASSPTTSGGSPTGSAPTSSGLSSTISPPTTSSNSLTKGAIAGIVIGAIALLVSLGVIVLLLLKRRRKEPSMQPTFNATVTNNPYTDNKAELDATRAGASSNPTRVIDDAMRTRNIAVSSPAPPSELTATHNSGHLPRPSQPFLVTTRNELPTNSPGGQPYAHIFGGEMDAAQQHTTNNTNNTENPGSFHPQAYTAPEDVRLRRTF